MTTFVTAQRKYLFRPWQWCELLLEIVYRYREQGNFALHAFVVMRDHVHLLITPTVPLEKAIQLIKGAFSHEARERWKYQGEIWQRGFADDRVKTSEQYGAFVDYIHANPVRAGIVQNVEDFPYSSAHSGFVLDEAPQGLKPRNLDIFNGTAKAVPSQDSLHSESSQTARLQIRKANA